MFVFKTNRYSLCILNTQHLALSGIYKAQINSEWLIKMNKVLLCHGEGNGNPLQCSCLENPRDGGTWWAAVYGVAQSQT